MRRDAANPPSDSASVSFVTDLVEIKGTTLRRTPGYANQVMGPNAGVLRDAGNTAHQSCG
jgi:hypothetical protein